MSLMAKARTILLVTLIAAAFTACEISIGTGGAGGDEVDPEADVSGETASNLWEQYQSQDNVAFVDDSYNNQWIELTLDGVTGRGIDAITGRAALLRAPGTLARLEFHFREDRDMENVEKGDKPKILCRMVGPNVARSKLVFRFCRHVENSRFAPDDA